VLFAEAAFWLVVIIAGDGEKSVTYFYKHLSIAAVRIMEMAGANGR
jgi:hypothetical protein